MFFHVRLEIFCPRHTKSARRVLYLERDACGAAYSGTSSFPASSPSILGCCATKKAGETLVPAWDPTAADPVAYLVVSYVGPGDAQTYGINEGDQAAVLSPIRGVMSVAI